MLSPFRLAWWAHRQEPARSRPQGRRIDGSVATPPSF